MTRSSIFEKKSVDIRSISARLFAENGFHATGMREICNATGYTLAAIYHYIRSKEDLLYGIQKHIFESILANLENQLKDIKDPVQKLRVVIINHIEHLASNINEMKVLIHESNTLTGVYGNRISSMKRQYFNLIKGIINSIFKMNMRSEMDPKVATLALFGALNWTTTWFHPTGSASAKSLADQFIQIFLHGLCGITNSGKINL